MIKTKITHIMEIIIKENTLYCIYFQYGQILYNILNTLFRIIGRGRLYPSYDMMQGSYQRRHALSNRIFYLQ